MIDLKLLARRSTIEKYEKNSIIIDEYKNDCDKIFILLVGNIKIYKNYKLPNQIELETMTPGHIFGEFNLYSKSSNLYTVEAIDEVIVAFISKRNFVSIAEINNDLFLQLIEVLCQRLLLIQNRLNVECTEKTKMVDQYGIDMDNFYKGLLFPRGHYTNYAVRPDEYENYIYKQTYTCPHCHEKFDDYTILSSKLVLDKELKCDLRRHYQSFDPIWYEVITCPNCFFSAFESCYLNGVKIDDKPLSNELIIINNGLKINFEEPRLIDRVFTSHYLALYSSSVYENSKQIDAKLWLSIYHMYGDIRNYSMEKFAAQKAYDSLNIYYTDCELNYDETQVVLMIMGSILRKLGKYDDAIISLDKAMRVPYLKSVYKKIIEDEMIELKKEKQKNIL